MCLVTKLSTDSNLCSSSGKVVDSLVCMKTHVITDPSQCLLLAPHMLHTDVTNAVLVCHLIQHQNNYVLSAIARLDLDTDSLPPSSACDDLVEFVADANPDALCLCWISQNLDELNLRSGLESFFFALLSRLRETVKKMQPARVAPIYFLCTNKYIWGQVQSREDHLIIENARPYQNLLETPFACELLLDDTYRIGGMWARVALRRRQKCIDVEKQYCNNAQDLNGQRLWTNSLAKIAHDPRALSPSSAVKILGGMTRIGKLNATLHDAQIRDRILLWVITGRKVSDPVAWEDCYSLMREAPMSYALPHRARAAVDILNACGSFSADDSPCAYGTIAYIYWWIGETEQAMTAAQLSLKSDPSYRMAQLISAIISARILPPWMNK